MTHPIPDTMAVPHGELVTVIAGAPTRIDDPRLTAAAQAALDAAEALGRKAAAPATLRAYKADWTHYAAWCAAHGFVPVPAAPATVGATLASLRDSHAPATVRRRLAAIGKMHRFNDLPWNSAHRDIAGPLGGLLREHGRPARKAAALTLAMLRQLVATCDGSNRGRRDRALLLIGFAAALRRSELVALRVEDVALTAQGLRVRIRRGKTDAAGEGAEIGLPRGRHAETCPARALEAWQAVARRKAGPLFRRVSTAGSIGDTALHPDAVRRILAHRPWRPRPCRRWGPTPSRAVAGRPQRARPRRPRVQRGCITT